MLNEHLLHLGERPSRVSDHIRMAVAGELRHQLALPRDTKLLVENMLFAYLDRGTTEIELTQRVFLAFRFAHCARKFGCIEIGAKLYRTRNATQLTR